MLQNQLTHYDILNIILVLVFTLISILFYWILFKKIEPHQRQSVYYFRLYFLLFALAFLSTIARVVLPTVVAIILAHTFYTCSTFAARQGILIRNGHKPVPLIINKWFYLNVFIVVILINTVLFYFVYDSLVARLFVTTINLSIISYSTTLKGFNKDKHQLNKADRFLFNFIIFMSVLNLVLPTAIYFLAFNNSAIMLVIVPQLTQVFLWTVALATLILLDMVDWYYQKSIIDKLTGLYNRSYFNQRINTSNSKLLIANHSNALLFIDIDFFKKINDTYGHSAGDLVIQRVAQKLQQCVQINNKQAIKTYNMAARLGGEEFAIFFENIDAQTAYNNAEKVRKSIEALAIDYDQHIINTTVSIGVTVASSNVHIDDMLKQADHALYSSKHSGRNKVTMYHDD